MKKIEEYFGESGVAVWGGGGVRYSKDFTELFEF
jgi:hypothetical protein